MDPTSGALGRVIGFDGGHEKLPEKGETGMTTTWLGDGRQEETRDWVPWSHTQVYGRARGAAVMSTVLCFGDSKANVLWKQLRGGGEGHRGWLSGCLAEIGERG